MKIIVASKNPVKVQAVTTAFELAFPQKMHHVEGIGVPSGVSDQPMSEEETRLGAYNRAQGAKDARPEADFWVGLEGGIAEDHGMMQAFDWMVVMGRDNVGYGRSAGFMLPPAVVDLIHQGMELGEADDVVFAKENSKQSNGAIGLLTHDLITRQTLYQPALLMALIPFLRPELYPPRAGEMPKTD